MITEVIRLDDQVSAGANSAARSVADLAKELDAAQGQFARARGQLGLAKAVGDKAAVDKYGQSVKSLAAQLFVLREQGARSSAELRKLQGAGGADTGAGAGGLLDLADAASQVSALTGSAGTAAAGLAAITAAAVAASTAVLGLGAAFVKLGTDADAANQQLRTSLGVFSGGHGKEVLDIVDAMRTRLPQSRDQLAEWVKTLQTAGVTDLGVLQQKTYALAATQVQMGETGTAAYISLQDKIQAVGFAQRRAAEMGLPFIGGLSMTQDELRGLSKLGVRYEDVAQQMGVSTAVLTRQFAIGRVDARQFGSALDQLLAKRGQGDIEAKLLTLPAVVERAREGFTRLFDSIDFKPVIAAAQRFLDLFNDQTETGKTFAELFKVIGDRVVDLATALIDDAGPAFVELSIFALNMFADVEPILSGLISLARTLVSALTSVLPSVEQIQATVAKGGIAQRFLGAGLTGGLNGIVVQGAAEFARAKLTPSGADTAAGATDGIRSGLAEALTGGRELGDATVQGYREEMGIKSPSRVMAALGQDTADGLVMGLGAGAGDASAAAAGLGSGVTGGAAKGLAGGAGASGGPSCGVTVEAGAIVVYAAPSQQAEDVAAEVLAKLLTRLAYTQGVGNA